MSKQILFSSDEAAKRVTVTGWVSRHGRFFGNDEKAARYDGCTHVECRDCGRPAPKGSIHCSSCYKAIKDRIYNDRPVKTWDGKSPIYSETYDRFFYDEDELLDYLEDTDDSIDSLRLRLCRPVYIRQIDECYFEDDLPEDVELPSEIKQAIAELNRMIQELPPMAWEPGEHAVKVELKGTSGEDND